MKALDKKLWRDLWLMKGQALAIILVIVSGVSTFVMFLSVMDSLNRTRDRFYSEYRFAEVFAPLKRAPESLRERIRAIPGVAAVETRVDADVKLDIPGFDEPVTAHLVSLPDYGAPLLDRLYLRQGRLPEPGRDNEVVVSEAFAQAHRFAPGSSFGAVINGRWKTLTVTGIALSPEFVLQAANRSARTAPAARRVRMLDPQIGLRWSGSTIRKTRACPPIAARRAAADLPAAHGRGELGVVLAASGNGSLRPGSAGWARVTGGEQTAGPRSPLRP